MVLPALMAGGPRWARGGQGEIGVRTYCPVRTRCPRSIPHCTPTPCTVHACSPPTTIDPPPLRNPHALLPNPHSVLPRIAPLLGVREAKPYRWARGGLSMARGKSESAPIAPSGRAAHDRSPTVPPRRALFTPVAHRPPSIPHRYGIPTPCCPTPTPCCRGSPPYSGCERPNHTNQNEAHRRAIGTNPAVPITIKAPPRRAWSCRP